MLKSTKHVSLHLLAINAEIIIANKTGPCI